MRPSLVSVPKYVGNIDRPMTTQFPSGKNVEAVDDLRIATQYFESRTIVHRDGLRNQIAKVVHDQPRACRHRWFFECHDVGNQQI